jgi:hypothetical protein
MCSGGWGGGLVGLSVCASMLMRISACGMG